MLHLHLHIFIAFFRSSLLGYGGGPSTIPLVHKEVVERYKWLSDQEFADVLALGNTLPGPIATKMAGYIGFRLAGIGGMINAIVATVVPTVLALILLLELVNTYIDPDKIRGMTASVSPVIGVMLLTLAYSYYKQDRSKRGTLPSLLILVANLIALELLGVHPAILILLILGYVLISQQGTSRREAAKKGEQA